MLQQRTVNNKYTELYIAQNGGGETWITEAFPTYFHTFKKQLILAPGDSADRYRECTAAEKTQLEAHDATWEKPSEDFIAEWDVKFGIWGQYNRSTGYFEGNTLLDITTEQARAILAAGPLFGDSLDVFSGTPFNKIRTNQPTQRCSEEGYNSRIYRFSTGACPAGIEIVNFNPADREREMLIMGGVGAVNGNIQLGNLSDYTFSCKKYIGVLNLKYFAAQYFSFWDAEDIKVKNLKTNFISRADKFLFNSFRYAIDNAANTTAINGSIKPAVLAALQGNAPSYPFNGGSQEEWMQLLEDAAAKNITFTTN